MIAENGAILIWFENKKRKTEIENLYPSLLCVCIKYLYYFELDDNKDDDGWIIKKKSLALDQH